MASAPLRKKSFTFDKINPLVKEMEYAVRGELVIKAYELQKELEALSPEERQKRPFQQILYCNIGNPQSVGQKPLTFPRQVLALCEYPQLLANSNVKLLFPEDAVERARQILEGCPSGLGAYTESKGLLSVRRSICQFLQHRDGYAADPETIFITNGASDAIKLVLTTLLSGSNDGVLIPLPQYPIYSALLTILNAAQLPYLLDEANGWALDISSLRRSLDDSRKKGLSPKALVVINPGNPTGGVLSEDNIKEIVQLCEKEGLLVLADEVYQENVYGAKPFVSFKKVVMDLGADVELISFHSTSKGLLGECGHRGGYMELHNIDAKVQAQLYKLASSQLCSNVPGQVLLDLLVHPPKEGDVSYPLWSQETSQIYQSLKRKSQALRKAFNEVEGISCCDVEGAMYAFPTIVLPPKAIEAAQKAGKKPDVFYALSLLEHTGICVVPGSGFGQKEGTYHFRTTFLPQEDKLISSLEAFKKHHLEFLAKYK